MNNVAQVICTWAALESSASLAAARQFCKNIEGNGWSLGKKVWWKLSELFLLKDWKTPYLGNKPLYFPQYPPFCQWGQMGYSLHHFLQFSVSQKCLLSFPVIGWELALRNPGYRRAANDMCPSPSHSYLVPEHVLSWRQMLAACSSPRSSVGCLGTVTTSLSS